MDRGRRWWRDGANRSLSIAVAVGFILRLAWALWATRTPPQQLSDPGQYQQIATAFAGGHTLRVGSTISAFWPPGYPMALAPLAWLSDKTGVMSLPMAASLLNVLAGTTTIAATGALASMWIGRSARNTAAWIMALAPGPIYLTSVTLSETWYTAISLIVLVLVTMAARDGWGLRRYAAIGLIVGYAALVRSPGALLVVAPLLAIRALHSDWRRGMRPTLAVLAGTVLVLTPWTIRNGVQVGVWTPTSTNNVAFLCLGTNDDGRTHQDAAEGARCYRQSAFDDPLLYGPGEVPPGFTFSHPDEAAWYTATLRGSLRAIRDDPVRQIRTIPIKTFDTFKGDTEALNDAEGFGTRPLVERRTRDVMGRAADIWLWAVIALGALGLAYVRRCRRALLLWGLVGLQVIMVWPGIGIERYHQPIMPLVAVCAAAGLTAVRMARSRSETIAADPVA